MCVALQVVAALDRKDICTQAFVRIITKKPGLKETNFQVGAGLTWPFRGLRLGSTYANYIVEFYDLASW